MSKSIISILLILVSSFAFSFNKGKLIQSVVSFNIEMDKSQIVIGNYIDLHLISYLENGDSSLSTDLYGPKIHFKDLDIEISGPVDIIKKGRDVIRIYINQNAINDPYITFEYSLKRKPQIHKKSNFPILFNGEYVVNYGISKPRAKVPYIIRLMKSDLEEEHRNGLPGINGDDLTIYISLLKIDQGKQELIKIEIRDTLANSTIRYLATNEGYVLVLSDGGPGDVGRGWLGKGGDGGDGGRFTVYITDEARPYYYQIQLDNYGGMAGGPGVKGESGYRGETGEILVIKWENKI